MQILTMTMPAIALFLTLNAYSGPHIGPAVSILFSLVMLLVLFGTFVKWQRQRTAQWRNALIATILISLFVGSPYLAQLPGVARITVERISHSQGDDHFG